MKPLLLTVLLVLTLAAAPPARAQDWGIGLRFGSPTAFTLKKYIGKTNALDINVGAGMYGLYTHRYGAYRGVGFSTMINYHFRRDIDGAEGLQWYYGFGGLLGVRNYWVYDDGRRNNGNDGYDNETRVSLGPTGAIGLEYFIPKAPISLFLEANPYVEIFPSPFYIGLGAGIGGRFMF